MTHPPTHEPGRSELIDRLSRALGAGPAPVSTPDALRRHRLAARLVDELLVEQDGPGLLVELASVLEVPARTSAALLEERFGPRNTGEGVSRG